MLWDDIDFKCNDTGEMTKLKVTESKVKSDIYALGKSLPNFINDLNDQEDAQAVTMFHGYMYMYRILENALTS